MEVSNPKIVVVGDIHEGISFGYNIDPETGIAARALDIHNNFARTAQYAITQQAQLFIILGDLFDRTNISPTIRELVRVDVIEPLAEHGIPVWIIAGNHDQPRSMARSTSLEDYRGYSHVTVYRKPEIECVQIANKTIGCIIMPYYHLDIIGKRINEELNIEVPQDQLIPVGQKLIKNELNSKLAELESQHVDHKILLAHYYIEHAQLRETASPEVLPNEFQFTQDMIPQNLDLAIFGHVHLHQKLLDTPPTIYTGAIERIDWGERHDPKGFIVLELLNANSNNSQLCWRFERLPVRDMLKIKLNLTTDTPTNEILKNIPVDVKGKMIRLELIASEAVRAKIDDDRISTRLRDAFHYEVCWLTDKVEKLGIPEFTMNPYELFTKFVETNYSSHSKYEGILREGRAILEEALGGETAD